MKDIKEIKFSHWYPKLPEMSDRALLMQVFEIDRKDISPVFLEYDTKYFHGDHGEDRYYKLPDGKLIVLLFYGNDDTVFTTIRRYTPGKFDYYKSCEGKRFKICILGDD